MDIEEIKRNELKQAANLTKWLSEYSSPSTPEAKRQGDEEEKDHTTRTVNLLMLAGVEQLRRVRNNPGRTKHAPRFNPQVKHLSHRCH